MEIFFNKVHTASSQLLTNYYDFSERL